VSLTIGPTKLFLIRYKTVQVKSTIILIENACLFCLNLDVRCENRQTPRVSRTADHTNTCYFHMGFHIIGIKTPSREESRFLFIGKRSYET